MLADLDLLLTAVFCTADDLLPERAKNAKRSVTDAEVVTLCVAQAVIGISSDREFLAVANEVRAQLTDSVITAAVDALPPPYLELERERLLTGLKARGGQRQVDPR